MNTIIIDRAVVEQALEALEYYQHRKLEWDYSDEVAITALRAALAQEQATMTADDLADSIKRGEKWKVIGCVGHDCEECQTRIAKDDLRTAAQQALEAMEKATRFMSDKDYRKLNESIDVLKAALAEPVQEPQPQPSARQMSPAAFAEIVKSREEIVGVPVYWAQWPNKETS